MSQITFSAWNLDYQIQRHIVLDCSSIKKKLYYEAFREVN